MVKVKFNYYLSTRSYAELIFFRLNRFEGFES